MYIVVSPFKNSFDEIGLIYFIPDFLKNDIKLGQIVEIPLKDNIEIGIILKILTLGQDYFEKNKRQEQKIDSSKIKSIISIYNSNKFLNKKQVELIFWISKYYFTFIHNSICLFFPVNLREKINKKKLTFLNKEPFSYLYNNKKLLTINQKKVFNQILESENNKILLFGLTGSGKTEIYINLINTYLKKEKQILLLIPEIILNNQIYNRLQKIFGKEILIINSSITQATKTKNWLNIYNNNAKIIIGTRSSLFYPYNNLGLIIIDEEHDNSYISDSNPRYNTIKVAEKITQLNGNKLLLATGTPSINSMYKGVKGDYNLINLLDKYK